MKRVLNYSLPILGVLILLVVVGYRYEQYVISRNFIIQVNTSCDPAKENCFISDCSPEDDLSCPDGPYKKVEILSADAPRCLQEHQCTEFTCDGIRDCKITYCAADILEDGESCSGT